MFNPSTGIYAIVIAICIAVVIVGGVHLADKLWQGGRAEAQREYDTKLAAATQEAEKAGDAARLAHDRPVAYGEAMKALRRSYCVDCKEAR